MDGRCIAITVTMRDCLKSYFSSVPTFNFSYLLCLILLNSEFLIQTTQILQRGIVYHSSISIAQ